MFLPSHRPRGAVLAGLMVLLACQAARVSAGVVTPASADASPAVDMSSTAARGNVEVAASVPPVPPTADADAFWIPGANSLELSVVPVPSKIDEGGVISQVQHPLIPLPGAAWTGMAGLLSLGAIKVLRNYRRLLA
jgi:hypothetical protein